jgi:hypothetical protein
MPGSLLFERCLFILLACCGAGLIWHVHYLPMLDLPQHAGQITALREILFGAPFYENEIWLNFFTPYLLIYLPATLLSLFMPSLAALKLIMTLGFFGLILSTRLLIIKAGADRAALWLVLPALFGWCWLMGMVTFLTALPLALYVIYRGWIYSEGPTKRRAIGLFLLGLVLFFSHGLAFYFAMLCAGSLMLLRYIRTPLQLVRLGWPFALLGMLALAQFAYLQIYAAETTFGGTYLQVPLTERLTFLLAGNISAPLSSLAGLCLIALLILPLSFAGLRRPPLPVIVLFSLLLLVILLLPHRLSDVSFVFQRFASFGLPFLCLFYQARPNAPALRLTAISLMAMCVGVIFFYHAQNQLNFVKSVAPFAEVLSELAPDKRLLGLLDEPKNPTYAQSLHMHAWYQAERNGWVDFNFAHFNAQIVRYKPGANVMGGGNYLGLAAFDWAALRAWHYDYIMIQHENPLPSGLFSTPPCPVRLVSQHGRWSVYEVQQPCATP